MTKTQLQKGITCSIIYTLLNQDPSYIAYLYAGSNQFRESLEELQAQIVVNSTYSDIPNNLKLKVYEFEYSQDKVDLMFNQLEFCRQYLKSKN